MRQLYQSVRNLFIKISEKINIYFMRYLENFDQRFAKVVLAGIPNKRFWEFVDRSDWTKYCARSWDKIHPSEEAPHKKLNIINNIAPYFKYEEMNKFRVMYEYLYKNLDDKLKKESQTNGFNVSDDGYSDLLSSIIGLGRDVCGGILNNSDQEAFKKVRKIVDRRGYAENFVYIFTTIETQISINKWNKRYRANNFDKNKEAEILNYVNSTELKRFWEFVKHTDWGTNPTEFFEYGKKNVLKNIAPHFSHEEFKKFRVIYEKLGKYLELRLEDVELYAEDDGLWDLRSSIIGYGKDIYIDVIKGDNDNKEIHGYDDRNDYYENFGYIFSYHDIDITVPEEDCKEEWDIIYNKNN